MALVMVVFNLRDGVSAEDYENWARTTDLPTVRGLGSVTRFEVMKSTGLLMGDGTPPYQYFELLDIADMDAFFADVGSPTMQKVAGEFQDLADNPVFINVSSIG